MKLRLSPSALQDLDRIYEYTLSQWGADQARRYLKAIWDQLETVTTDPERHRIRSDIYPDCRIAYEGRHAIVYRVRDGRAEIGRVLHGSMDLKRHLPEGFLDD